MWPSQRCCEIPKIYRNVRPQRLYAVNLLWNKKKRSCRGDQATYVDLSVCILCYSAWSFVAAKWHWGPRMLLVPVRDRVAASIIHATSDR